MLASWSPAPMAGQWTNTHIEPVYFCIEGDAAMIRPQIWGAFQEVMTAAGVPWGETRDCLRNRTVTFRRVGFGPWSTFLGLAMYPAPLVDEPFAGDIWIERGVTNPETLRSLLLHEILHAIGFTESSDPESIMWPVIVSGRGITPDVYWALQDTYRR